MPAIEENLAKGIDVFLDIDWQGAQQIRQKVPSVKSIFILPPSLPELERRLVGRGQDSKEVIAERMSKAISEISHYDEYDYVIVNDNFEQAFGRFTKHFAGRTLDQSLSTNRKCRLNSTATSKISLN